MPYPNLKYVYILLFHSCVSHLSLCLHYMYLYTNAHTHTHTHANVTCIIMFTYVYACIMYGDSVTMTMLS